MAKKCTKCGELKPLSEFGKDKSKKDGFRPSCKKCDAVVKRIWRSNNKEKVAEYKLKYREDNREKIAEYKRIYNKANADKIAKQKREYNKKNKDKIAKNKAEYYLSNHERFLEKSREYCAENREANTKRAREWRKSNPERDAENHRRWREENREYLADYRKARWKENAQYRLSCLLRTRLNKFVSGGIKSGSAVSDLGCSVHELKDHLESQFKEGMTWDNLGVGGWHIDHIVPLSSFDLTDREQLLEACHYTNLQPLWAEENLRKGNKIQGE